MNAPTHSDILSHIVLLLPVAFVSLTLPLFARARRGILFGITVPLDFATGPVARVAIRRYRVSVGGLAVLVLGVLLLVLQFSSAGSSAAEFVIVAAVPLELIAAFLLWSREAAALKPFAAAVPLERHADLAPPSATLPLAATASALVPIAATALYLRLRWNAIPVRWPNHFDALGIANGWGTRTVSGVFAPLLLGALVVAVLFAVGLFLARASGPQSSQRRRALAPVAGIAWLAAGMVSLVGLLPLTHLGSTHFPAIALVYLVAVFGVAFWLMWRSGLAPQSETSEAYDSTPDSGWHGGIIYYNPADAAVLVPKRFGLGWTLNFARATAWVYTAGILLVTAAIIAFTVFLK